MKSVVRQLSLHCDDKMDKMANGTSGKTSRRMNGPKTYISLKLLLFKHLDCVLHCTQTQTQVHYMSTV